MELRGYQNKLIHKIENHIKNGYRSIVAVLGCGGGKSIIQAEITYKATLDNKQVLFLVHRKELCEQIKNTFRNHGVNMALCNIVSTQTYKNKSYKYPKPNLIIVDEAHTNLNIYKKVFDENDCIKLGFTATPTRLKEGGIGQLFDILVESVSTQWLIDNNYLSDFKYYSFKLVDTANLKIKAGDYDKTELKDVMENNIIYLESVKQWLKLAKDKKTIVYCTSIKSSQETTKEFIKQGINAVHLDGTTPKKEREKIINDFREDKINVLCNAMLFSEGYDDKNIECVMLLRPTMSLALNIQQSMRGMRYKGGKTCIIIDCVGNIYKHGLPTETRKWNLEGKMPKETIKIKECPSCFAVYSPNKKECPFCGFESKIIIDKPSSKKEISGDLVEIDKTFKLSNIKLKDFNGKTWKEVEEFRKAKNYKFAWSLHYAINNKIPIPPKYNSVVRSIIK